MSDNIVPFWSISSGDDSSVPANVFDLPEGGLTPARFDRVRKLLEAYADSPPLTLERHAIAKNDVPEGGALIQASSPLLKSLQQVVGTTTKISATERAAGSTEVLYRAVVPKEVAGKLATGAARPMTARGGTGIYSAIRDRTGIIAHAKFVPVATAGAGTGAAGGAVASVTVGGALVAAAPLAVLLAATAASVYAEEQRRRALERLQTSLDELKRESFENERDELNGAVGAIKKATSVLADEGRLGISLGLDSAVHAIDTALARAASRIAGWERGLAYLGPSATPETLKKQFPTIEDPHGEFRTKVQMAGFAIAMKTRVAVLQAAEHTKLNTDLNLTRFTRELAADITEIDHLTARLTVVLEGLASVAIKAPDRRRDLFFTPGEVRDFLAWGPRLNQLAAEERPQTHAPADVELSIVVHADGTATVFEPVALVP